MVQLWDVDALESLLLRIGFKCLECRCVRSPLCSVWNVDSLDPLYAVYGSMWNVDALDPFYAEFGSNVWNVDALDPL